MANQHISRIVQYDMVVLNGPLVISHKTEKIESGLIPQISATTSALRIAALIRFPTFLS
jgi:hypothetical protein